MKCLRCKSEHKWSWNREGQYDPEWEECSDDEGSDDHYEYTNTDVFHIKDIRQLRCKGCGATSFMVGRASYQTVIKCLRCGWEDTVHEG